MSDEYQNEEWESLPDDPDYQVSNLGRVKSLKGGKERLLKPSDFGGYLLVSVPFEGRMRRVGVHRLVMLVFAGRCPEGKQVHHLDHQKHNNRLNNLLYVTPKENAQAAIPFRRVAARERERQRKLEYEERVRRVNQANETGVMPFDLAKERLDYLCFRRLKTVIEVIGIPNTFDITLYSALDEDRLSRLMNCGFYAYPKDLVSNEYRVTWWPD